MNKIKPISFYLFALFNNYVFICGVCLRNMYEEGGKAMYLPFLIGIVVSVIMYFLIPVREKNELAIMNQRKSLKIIFSLYLAFSFIITFDLALQYIHILESEYSRLIILLTLGASVFLLSKLPSTKIIKLSTAFLLPTLLIIFLNYALKTSLIQLDLLLPFSFRISLKNIFFVIYIIIDNYFLLVLLPATTRISKKSILIINVLLMVILTLESIILVGIVGSSYLKGFPRIGFTMYSISLNTRYLGSFQFLYIVLITMTSLFHLAIHLSMLRILLKKEWILIIIILIGAITSIFNIELIPILFAIICLILLVSYFLERVIVHEGA